MTTNNDELPKEADAVETEVAKGEQNETFEEHVQLKEEQIKKPRPKPKPKIVKSTISKIPVKRISPRIEELARPVKNNVLATLRDKAWILPPALVDNLIRIIEAETCLSPEEATRVLRSRKKRKKKAIRFPPFVKKWPKEITRLPDTVQAPPRVDRNAAICQYLLAVNFVKSILERQCQTRRKDVREIARVILKRLTSINKYTDTQNGDDRATQQLHLLAEIIACWIADILVEVAEVHKETLEEYCEKRKMKEMEVDDDEETDSEAEYWKQMEQKYEIQEKHEVQEKHEDEVVEQETEQKEDVKEEIIEPEIKKEIEDEETPEAEKEENEIIGTQLEE